MASIAANHFLHMGVSADCCGFDGLKRWTSRFAVTAVKVVVQGRSSTSNLKSGLGGRTLNWSWEVEVVDDKFLRNSHFQETYWHKSFGECKITIRPPFTSHSHWSGKRCLIICLVLTGFLPQSLCSVLETNRFAIFNVVIFNQRNTEIFLNFLSFQRSY